MSPTTTTARTSVGQSDSGDELCSFTQPLELTTYNYRVHFSPSSAAAVSGEVKIAQTGNSTKFRPQLVECGANLTCSCLTTTEDSEKLVKTEGQREDNGTQFTCHVTWTGNLFKSLTYTLIANWTVEEDIPSIPVTSSSTEAYVGVVVAVLALTGIAAFLAVYFKCRYNYSRKAADQTPDLTGTELYASTSRREESRHRYSTLRHTDTAYEEPLPPAQHPRGPSNPTSTPATHQEDTQYSDMELFPTEITYQAPIPPTQDVHTYMMLHNIHSATTAPSQVLDDPGDDGNGP
ncbi:uncharacterized protein LOC112569001 isoform X2 [Pomacea canaliculata]|uniref:uncharacterized protein LOC112569001 isoform X2 n=1 Tax=Pomacea canaliculata TaxID=400727 RepID=UPI000D7351B9|nr:uncharacterized protein LOC112569001 isoform X2 [Pomacea canaliculata]XP_025102420.1 uncharacterized protein LOC112569001 isoform X2 [Pomacea canaliculata]